MNLIVHVRYIYHHGLAVLVHLLFDGEAAEVLCFVVGNLLTVHGEGLREVAEAIEETDSTHINIGVGSLLDVVTGEDTETAGVDLQRLVQAILHAEVCYAGTVCAGLDIHVSTELIIDVIHLLDDGLVLSELGELLVVQAFEHEHRILSTLLIEDGVEMCEKTTGAVIPSPPHIVG